MTPSDLHPTDREALRSIEQGHRSAIARCKSRSQAIFSTLCAIALGVLMIGAFAEALFELGGLR